MGCRDQVVAWMTQWANPMPRPSGSTPEQPEHPLLAGAQPPEGGPAGRLGQLGAVEGQVPLPQLRPVLPVVFAEDSDGGHPASFASPGERGAGPGPPPQGDPLTPERRRGYGFQQVRPQSGWTPTGVALDLALWGGGRTSLVVMASGGRWMLKARKHDGSVLTAAPGPTSEMSADQPQESTSSRYVSVGVPDGFDPSSNGAVGPEALLAGFGPIESAHPFERNGLFRRVLPFAIVSVLAEASLALSPSSTSLGYALLSAALLGLVAVAFFLPWGRLPAWMTVLVPLIDVASIAALILATGSAASGVGIVILVPLLWTSLYHRRWESYVIVGAVVLVELLTSLTPVRVADAVLLRRLVFWSALGLLVAFGTNALRDRLRGSIAQREENLRRMVGFAAAAEELTTRLDPDQVLTAATRLAAEIVSPDGGPGRRAQYSRIVGDMVHVVTQYDEAGMAIVAPFPLSEQPNMVEAIETDSVIQRPLDPGRFGPVAREIIRSLGVTRSVYVPIHYAGFIDGVLSIPMRGGSVGSELLDFCRGFGHLVELALGNAYVHQDLAAQATTDNLTGLPNQRAFVALTANPPGRTKFAIMVIDLDGLKYVNDAWGHEAGDQLLIQAAGILKDSIRQGDAAARIGGDEFAAFLFDASAADAISVGERILAKAPGTASGPTDPHFSIGIAAGDVGADPVGVLGAADRAMYRAKSAGGSRLALAGDQPPLTEVGLVRGA